MRRSRLVAWLACGAGAALVLRRRLRRPRPAAPGRDPAAELKRKLEESRAGEPAPGPPAPEPEQPAAGLDERRREVHERGRAAIDQMRGSGQAPAGESE